MIRLLFLMGFLSLAGIAHAQEQLIEQRQKLNSKLDSLNALANRQWLTDSLSITGWGDSLKNKITGKLAANTNKLNHKIDSLNNLKLPTGKYQHKLDSMTNKSNQLLAEVNQKQQELFGKTKVNLTAWQEKTKLNLGQLNTGFDLPADLKIPALNTSDFVNLSLSPELTNINAQLPFGKVDGLTNWQQNIPGMENLPNLKDIQSNPDKLIETAATNINGMNELKEKLDMGGLENSELGKIAQNAKNPEALKEQAIEQAKQQAIDHFAGKEQVLQAAMEQVAKYKQKYESVSSLSEIKNLKRPPNPLKGKPFVERLVPGIAMQIHTKGYLNFDFNPYAGYKITPKLTAGLGWNQRLAMDWSNKKLVPDGRVFGPRTYVEYKLPRGFGLRIEGEWLNTYVPSYAIGTTEGRRQWVFSTMTGLKKEYRFFKKIKGFTIVQFDIVRLIKPNRNSPYADVVNTRFGFEFGFKKKKKPKGDY